MESPKRCRVHTNTVAMTNNRWEDLLNHWLLYKTFGFLSIHDLRSLRSVNLSLKASIDSFVDSMSGNFGAMIGPKAFTVIASFLSLDDLSKLNLVNKGCRFGLRVYSTSLPRDVRALVRTWQEGKGFAFLMHSFNHVSDTNNMNRDRVLYHPPFLKLSLGPMTYDQGSARLKGQPLEEIQLNDLPPINLGRDHPFTCAVDDSVIFYCGGETTVERVHDHQWGWTSRRDVIHRYSSTAAMFNVKTGAWRTLPRLPEARGGGAAVRIGSRIYVLGGVEPIFDMYGTDMFDRSVAGFVLIFSLETETWVSNNYIKRFPSLEVCSAAASVGDDIHIVVVSKNRAFLLNTITGVWHKLPSLPMKVGSNQSVLACQVVENSATNEHIVIVVGKKSWATLVLSKSEQNDEESEQWELETDMCGYDMKLLRFTKNKVQVLTGNTWTLMDSDDITKPIFYGGRITAGSVLRMSSCLVGYWQG